MDIRFNNEVPHKYDTNLKERCQEELRNYEIYSKYVEPINHTISYIAAAYLSLMEKYDELEKQVKEEF